eukprot:2525817-Rhodomonas_salina.2
MVGTAGGPLTPAAAGSCGDDFLRFCDDGGAYCEKNLMARGWKLVGVYFERVTHGWRAEHGGGEQPRRSP